MDYSMEAVAIAINDHRKSLDGRLGRAARASDMSGSLASSFSASLFGLSPRPSVGTYMPLERASSDANTVFGRNPPSSSFDRPSYAGEDFESLVQGYAGKAPAASAPVPVPAAGGPTSPAASRPGLLMHCASLPLRLGVNVGGGGGGIGSASMGGAAPATSPVVGRQQAKALGDIDLYWRSMYQD